MEIFKIVLAANFFSFYFITQNGFHEKFKLRFRPFNCTLCLTAWTALALYWLPNWVTDMTIVMFGAGVVSPFFKNFLNNLYEPKRP